MRYHYSPIWAPPGPDTQGNYRVISRHPSENKSIITTEASSGWVESANNNLGSPDRWPEVSSASLFAEFQREQADRPESLRDVKAVSARFSEAFPTIPSNWPPPRDWLNQTFPGETRTRLNRFNAFNATFGYGVRTLKVLPSNPLEGAPRPTAKSKKAAPLSSDLLIRLHGLAMQRPLRDKAIWLCRFALGWRPVECRRLTLGDVRNAAIQDDGYIMREQKPRRKKEDRSPSPMLPEVLVVLNELAGSMHELPDHSPILYGTRGRHKGKPLGDQGIRGVIPELFMESGIRDQVPDAIPYDLRDSFAA